MGGGGGGGGVGARPPNVPTKKKSCMIDVTHMRERAPQQYMYFQVSKYICIHIQSMRCYGTLNYSTTEKTVKTLTLRKIYEYASERA